MNDSKGIIMNWPWMLRDQNNDMIDCCKNLSHAMNRSMCLYRPAEYDIICVASGANDITMRFQTVEKKTGLVVLTISHYQG